MTASRIPTLMTLLKGSSRILQSTPQTMITLHSNLTNCQSLFAKGSMRPHPIQRTWPPLPRNRDVEEVLAPSLKMRSSSPLLITVPTVTWLPGRGDYSQYQHWTGAGFQCPPASVESGLLMDPEGQGHSPCYWPKGLMEPKARLHQYTGWDYHQGWDCRHP